MKEKVIIRLSEARTRKVKRLLRVRKGTVSDLVEDLLDKAVELPARRSWVDELFGSAKFSDADLANDERLRDLVKGARTKPRYKTGKKA